LHIVIAGFYNLNQDAIERLRAMSRLGQLIKMRIRKSIERDRALEQQMQTASRSLWPWKDWRLPLLATVLVLLDFTSTYACLELSGNTSLYEGGLLAAWSLRNGGYPLMFIVDLLAVGTLIGVALLSRAFFTRQGLSGYGRISFLVILLPYTVVTFAIVFNNIVLTFI
jgi:hypothetical protein